MFIIAGLGNPGGEYHQTRHNVGFAVLDYIADQLDITIKEKKHKGLIGKGRASDEPLLLVKPQTFMNLSGECIGEVCHYYKVDPTSQLLVIYDDVDLPCGDLRIRENGSAGTHNGMKSITRHLGGGNFMRLRVGIGGAPIDMVMADYVLGRFSKEEAAALEEVKKNAYQATMEILNGNIDKAMNTFNKRRKVAVSGEVLRHSQFD